jgi:hypothetical protein
MAAYVLPACAMLKHYLQPEACEAAIFGSQAEFVL